MIQEGPSIASDNGSCSVPHNDPQFQQYHDEEWGVPNIADKAFFEKICLEGFQSGLSWRTVLHRREAFRELFDGFDIDTVARYDAAKLKNLVSNPRIIRNQRKIASTVNNANRAIELRKEYGSLAHFFWQFEPDAIKRPTKVNRTWLANNTQTAESAAMAKALKQRGWSFVGPTNMYALMQALGIVNDHVEGCPRHATIKAMRASFHRPVWRQR